MFQCIDNHNYKYKYEKFMKIIELQTSAKLYPSSTPWMYRFQLSARYRFIRQQSIIEEKRNRKITMELEPMDLENYDEYLVKYVLLEKTKNRKYLETLKDEKFREDVINNMLKVFDVRAEIIEAIIGNILAKNQLSIERILWLAKVCNNKKLPLFMI